MVLKLSKIVSFLYFFADVSNKSKVIKAVYAYAFEIVCFTLFEIGIGYYGMT